MTRRRKVLLLLVAVGLIANAGLLVLIRLGNDDEIRASWIAYMPGLEASQWQDRINLLEHSEGRDPDYPQLIVWEGRHGFHLFPRLAAACGIRAYSILQYVRPMSGTDPLQMPERFFVGGTVRASQVRCMRESLPTGYVFAELDGEFKPSTIGWGEGELPLLER